MHAVGDAGLTVSGGTAQLGGTGGDQIYDLTGVTVTSGAFDTNGRNETFRNSLHLQGSGIGSAGALVNSGDTPSYLTPTAGTTLTGNATIGVTQPDGDLAPRAPSAGTSPSPRPDPAQLDLEGSNTFSGGLTVAQGTIITNSTAQQCQHHRRVGQQPERDPRFQRPNRNVAVNHRRRCHDQYALHARRRRHRRISRPAAASPELTGAIGGAGALLVGSGATLTLSGNNTFTGGVTVDGILQIGSAGALNAINPNVVTFGGTSPFLKLDGISVAVGGLNSIARHSAYAAEVDNDSSTPASLTVNISGAVNDSFMGFIEDGTGGGPLSLVKAGAGTLTLSGATRVHGHDDDQRRHAPHRRRWGEHSGPDRQHGGGGQQGVRNSRFPSFPLCRRISIHSAETSAASARFSRAVREG